MTRKKLPRAIARLAAELHEADPDEVVSEEPAPKPKRPRRAKSAAHKPEASTPPEVSDPVVPAPREEPPPLTGEVIPPDGKAHEPQQASRRETAEKTIVRYTGYAALGGLLPLPAANVAALTALNMRLVKALSDLYGVPFEANQTRSMILGLIGGTVPTGLGFATGSMIGLIMPIGAFVGLAVSSVSGAALTRNIGLLFIESFEKGTPPYATAPPAAAS
jgi:uncharacterized protein (DUF697 family)